MNYIKINSRHPLMICFLTLGFICVLASCKKNEEPPIPIGKPIPYPGQIMLSLDSALNKSPYKLFAAAWKRSGIDSLIKVAQPGPLTVFAPTDSAMTAAGYTQAAINIASKANLDTLLAFHVVLGTYADSTLATLQGSAAAQTLLSNPNPPASALVNPGLSFNAYSSSNPYLYILYICADYGFSINGKQVTTNQKNISAYRALIHPINQVLQRPTQDLLAILRNDPRFSYLLQSYRLIDSVISFAYNPYYPYNPYIPYTNAFILAGTANSTLFAPTNDAFTKYLAGIYQKPQSSITFNDLKNYQNRVPYTYNVSFSGIPLTPLDSVIDVYFIVASVGVGKSPGYPVVTGTNWFYTDLLYNSAALSGYLITPAQAYNNVPAVIVGLDFIPTGNQVVLKRHNSASPATVNITQRDIVATNGVLHVVDGILPQ